MRWVAENEGVVRKVPGCKPDRHLSGSVSGGGLVGILEGKGREKETEGVDAKIKVRMKSGEL